MITSIIILDINYAEYLVIIHKAISNFTYVSAFIVIIATSSRENAS